MSNPTLISILVVNYNGGTRLQRCVDCLAAQTYTSFEVIVIDNASTDGSENINLPDARFRVIKSDTNLGFAAGNNRAAAGAKGEWIGLMNPDAYAEPDWLAMMVDATVRHPACVMFGSTQINDREPHLLDGCGDCYNFAGFPWRGGIGWSLATLPHEGAVFAPCAAAAMYRADVFHALGGFDERFFCYCEDVDLAFRMRLLGHHCVQVTGAVVRHEGSGITGVGSPFSVFHGSRNRIWTYVKNMPPLLLWPFLPFHILGNLILLCHIPTAKTRWKGIRAAFKGLKPIWQSRRELHASRKASTLQIARALTWSLDKMMKRHEDVRPLVPNTHRRF
jgi:GT2 family glycosyltransferase